MSEFRNYLASTLTILGTVIGAGFISGREIATFFYGYDPLISSLLFSTGFSVVLFILFFDRSYIRSKWFSFSKPLIYIGNLILAAGMLSALDAIYRRLFPNITFPILSLVALIVSNVIVSGGVNGLKSSNLILTPIIIVVTIVMIFLSDKSDIGFTGNIPIVKVCEYIGLNVFLSSILFSELALTARNKSLFFAAITASFILAVLIFFISSSIFKNEFIFDEMPLLTFSMQFPVLKHAFFFALFFGVFTTLLSSHYPLYNLVQTKKLNVIVQFLLSSTIFSISRLGFYNIVSGIYPIIGAVGFLYIVVTSILQAFFRSVRPKNTLSPQADIK